MLHDWLCAVGIHAWGAWGCWWDDGDARRERSCRLCHISHVQIKSQGRWKLVAGIALFCALACPTPALAWEPAPMTRSELSAHMAPYWGQIVGAIYLAEGGPRAKKPFGILSVPCSGYEECREVCYNTVRNNYFRWIQAGRPGDYLEFLARRYAPVGAANDPGGLNRHWLKNVRHFLEVSDAE